MSRYIPSTPQDEEIMLKSLNLDSLENLFDDIPQEVRLQRKLNLGDAMSELELARHMKKLAQSSRNTEELVCFLGAGAYDHYIPSVIKHITSRSEFYTAYTPYQPEISQGTLQAIFEYQTMICSLTGLDVANASVYDGATACVEAAMMSVENSKRNSIVVSRTVHPEVRRVLHTYMKFKGVEVIEVDEAGGITDIDKLRAAVGSGTAGVIIQNPNFFGIIEDLSEVEKAAHDNKSLFVLYTDPISLGLLKSPGEIGADIAVGEGQPLGNSLSFGGPYLGFMAANARLLRKMPGRIVGQTEDVDGKRGFVLTLQTREQHIRREKATSNICSNQALNALTATVYLAAMGKKGLMEAALQSTQKAHFAFDELTKSGKYKPVFNKPFFKEFAVEADIPAARVNAVLLDNEILGGYDLSRDYPFYNNTLLFCVTEKRTRDEIDNLVRVMEGMK